jgi:hypothetical protein
VSLIFYLPMNGGFFKKKPYPFFAIFLLSHRS